MDRLKLIVLFLLVPSLLFGATVYVDPTLEADCDGISTHYDPATRACVSGAGAKAWNTLQEAIYGAAGTPGAAAGDTIYLRGGTYQENYGGATGAMRISTALNGTAEAWTTISSYPGEWAIIDGNGAVDYVMGFGSDSTGDGQNTDNHYRYIKIERLEITGASASAGHGAGLAWAGGPVWVRYCYIHDNGYGTESGGNSGGLKCLAPMGNTIEYCYFSDNYGNPTGHNKGHLFFYADYGYDDNDYTGAFNIGACMQRNEVRYNHFDDGCEIGIKHKAPQYLGSRTSDNMGIMNDMTYQTYGDKYHHNIFIGQPAQAGMLRQDFLQFYNNIIVNANVYGEEGSSTFPTFHKCWYNNTIINGYMADSMGYSNPLHGKTYNALDLGFRAFNNIVSEFGVDYYSPSIGIAVMWDDAHDCTLDYTWTYTLVDRNLIYKPESETQHIGLPNSQGTSCKSTRWVTVSAFNTLRSVTNYTTATDGLFLGESGANQYITSGSFVVGSSTIATGGIGGDHPYLSGVTIPSYVGAVNPSDSDWVAGVLGLATDANSDNVPDNLFAATAGSDPTWIEGSGSSPSTATIRNGSIR